MIVELISRDFQTSLINTESSLASFNNDVTTFKTSLTDL